MYALHYKLCVIKYLPIDCDCKNIIKIYTTYASLHITPRFSFQLPTLEELLSSSKINEQTYYIDKHNILYEVYSNVDMSEILFYTKQANIEKSLNQLFIKQLRYTELHYTQSRHTVSLDKLDTYSLGVRWVNHDIHKHYKRCWGRFTYEEADENERCAVTDDYNNFFNACYIVNSSETTPTRKNIIEIYMRYNDRYNNFQNFKPKFDLHGRGNVGYWTVHPSCKFLIL